MQPVISRREWLASTGAAAGGMLAPAAYVASAAPSEGPRFRYCLNTSTVRADGLDLPEKIDIAARAGYDGIEPWIREIEQYQQAGGALNDLARRIRDAGLIVESAIGFAHWIVDDENRRRQALGQVQREMELLRQIGGTRMAAPPAGATRGGGIDLFQAAKRYAALLQLGERTGVLPQLEIWGSSKTLSRLGEAVFVAVESGHEQACLLPDVYHIFKGGSEFHGLNLLGPRAVHVFHINDYPAAPPRKTITDADRVFPGDGIAPLEEILQTLSGIGFRGALSLELFNRDYWQRDPLEVARVGLEKMRDAVQRALA